MHNLVRKPYFYKAVYYLINCISCWHLFTVPLSTRRNNTAYRFYLLLLTTLKLLKKAFV